MQKLNGREIFSGIYLLLATTIYLVLQVRELLSGYSDAIRTNNGTIELSRSELIHTFQMFLFIVLGMTGSILLLRKKRAGWIISFPSLLFLSALLTFIFVKYAAYLEFDHIFVISCLLILLLILATVFLLFPSTLKKFRVDKRAILPTLVLFMALIGVLYLSDLK